MRNLILHLSPLTKSFAKSFLPLLAFLFFFAHMGMAQERTPGTVPPSSDSPAAFNLQTQQQQGDELSPFYSESGLISLSTDGLGTDDGGGTVQIDKPAGATVRQAFLLSATTVFPVDGVLNDGDVILEGTPIIWDERVSFDLGGGFKGESGYADVTSLVQPVVDPAPAGTVELQIAEPDTTEDIDGEILAVVFDDPNRTEPQTVALAFGAQNPAGDNFAIQLAEPFDQSAQSIRLGLGLSFGFQAPFVADSAKQFSIVEVNGDRLTSAAGGQDDCEGVDSGSCGNGTLLTVGGVGDSEDNPSDPNAGPDGDPRADDELYTLDPFIDDGDTQVDVFTQNPSDDDNIFFASFVVEGTVAIVGEDLLLEPPSDTNEVGDEHTLTATVQNDAGDPVEGADVTFEVTSGPNAGLTGSDTTGADGEALFTYSSSEAGTDAIVASFVDSEGETVTSNEVTKVWKAPEDQTPPVCGTPQLLRNDQGRIVAVETSATDEESGIASVTFVTLRNFIGSVDGNGSFSEGGTYTTPDPNPTTVVTRGDRPDLNKGAAFETKVTNGAGLSSHCDPATERLDSVPEGFSLKGNYPNPFSEQTTIEFHVAEKRAVRLEVFDLLGRKVKTLVDKEMEPGAYRVTWDAGDLASGTYLYRIKAGSFTEGGQMTVVK